MLKLRSRNQGMVSITVVMIIMLILTLIVLAFARIVRREQRQSLDRQLNTQAFYAAETGVNDAINAIKTTPALATFESGDDCNSFITAASLNNNLSSTSSYSCLLMNSAPSSLVYDNVDTAVSQVVPIQKRSIDPNITELKIAWQDKSGSSNFGGCPATTTNVFTTGWPASCSPGIMRLDLVPFDSSMSRESLSINSGVIYLVPTNGAADSTSIAFSTFSGSAGNPANQGQVASVACNNSATPRHCVATITGLNISKAYLRLKSIYKSSAVTIIARSGGTQLAIVGSQAVIDATGKSSDILRRIQVRVPLFKSNPEAEYALEVANSVCKRLQNDGTNVTTDLLIEPDCNPQQPHD